MISSGWSRGQASAETRTQEKVEIKLRFSTQQARDFKKISFKMTTVKERLVFLGEEAKEVDEEIALCIFKVKEDNSYDDNLRGLNECSVPILQKTYAYLYNKEMKDVEVTRLKKTGLMIQVYKRLEQLMPEQCGSNCQKTYFYLREEEAMVRCRRCGKGACKDCHPQRNLQWRFLCSGCDALVMTQCDLENKHVSEAAKKKEEKEKEKDKETIKSSQAPGQEVFGLDTAPTQQVVVDLDKEEEENDQEDKDDFVEPKKKGFKKGENKEKEKKKDEDETKKICHFYKSGHCRNGFNGKLCSFSHPRACRKLMDHGSKGHLGCEGKTAGCKNFHPRMCYSKTCEDDCKRGYHIKDWAKKRDSQKSEGVRKESHQVRHEPRGQEKEQHVSDTRTFANVTQNRRQENQEVQELRQGFQELRQDVRRLMQMLASPGNGGNLEQRMESSMVTRKPGIWTGDSWVHTREGVQAALRDPTLFHIQGGGARGSL